MNDYEQAIHDKFRAEGFTVLRNGWPDFLCLSDTRVFCIEAKQGTDFVKPSQIKMHTALMKLGIPTVVLRPEDFGKPLSYSPLPEIGATQYLKLPQAEGMNTWNFNLHCRKQEGYKKSKLGYLASLFIADHCSKPGTVKTYGRVLGSFLRVINKTQPYNVFAEDIRQYVLFCKKRNLASASIGQRLTVISSFFQWMIVRYEHVFVDPVKEYKFANEEGDKFYDPEIVVTYLNRMADHKDLS